MTIEIKAPTFPESVADGTIACQEGNTLMNMLAATTKGIETFQLEQRLAALELALQLRKPA